MTHPPSQFFILILIIILSGLMKVLRRVKPKSLYTTYIEDIHIQPRARRLLFFSNHSLWSVIKYIKNHIKIWPPVLANILFKNHIRIWPPPSWQFAHKTIVGGYGWWVVVGWYGASTNLASGTHLLVTTVYSLSLSRTMLLHCFYVCEHTVRR